MESKLREVMADVLEVRPDAFHDRFGPSDAARWDSLTGLRLVTAIEEAFHVEFTMGEIQEMTTFGAILRALRSRSES